MSASLKLIENPERTYSMHPKKFALWLFMGTVVMVFASLTSAFIVKRGDGNWRLYDLPEMFWYSTAIILVSSITMMLAYRAAKRDKMSALKASLSTTLILGITFFISQFMSWGELVNNKVYFAFATPSESFTYILTGLHLLHIISSVIFCSVVLVNAFNFKVHSKSMVQIEMLSTYWHFLGALWIYLFVFLMFYHQ